MTKEEAQNLAETVRTLAEYVENNYEYVEDFSFEGEHDPIVEEDTKGHEVYSQGSNKWTFKIWEKDKYECRRIARAKSESK